MLASCDSGVEGKQFMRKMSTREAGFYWRIKELKYKIKIDKSRQRERESVKQMSKKEIETMHDDYLFMLAEEKQGETVSRYEDSYV